LLPGGRGGVSPNAFAISSGTNQPELAYALVEYLSKSPLMLQFGFGELPARRSLIGAQNESEFAQFFTESEEVTALKLAAIENGIPESDLQLYNFLRNTVESYATTFEDGSFSPEPETAEEAQQYAVETLRLVDQWRNGREAFVVVTPVPTPIINQGQIVLRFRVTSTMSPMPNADLWDTFIAEFIASEPELGNIDLETGFGGPNEGEQPDCFYTPFNQVNALDLNTLIPLDPFMDSDPDFDPADVLGATLTQLQRGGQTWAYPISIQPEVIAYNSQYLTDAGLDFPPLDWTIDQLIDTMTQIQQANPDMEHIFRMESGATPWFMLFAAYGGLPMDYSTNPPTLNLTDPTAIEAIRQVLDLAKTGLIEYQELEALSFGGSGGGIQPAFRATNFNNLVWTIAQMNEDRGDFVDPTRYTVFPRGVDYTPVSYSIGTGYISATSRSPEICYRLLKAIASRSDLALGMPARSSLVEDPMLDSAVGEPVADLYRRYAEALAQPNAVFIPSAFSFDAGISAFIEPLWIYRAFDNYVLRDGDLEADLMEAERLITEYRACVPDVGTIDLLNLSPLESIEIFQQFTDCAEQIDPSLEGRFGL
jgi:ABC-type glycerol-3-phosphate transport system substrate-binding protein